MTPALVAAAPSRRFAIPEGAEATEPAEQRGLSRDGVRLLVATANAIEHTTFGCITQHLAPGDLLVVNTSATLAAALDARVDDNRYAPLHLSTVLDDGSWVVEFRLPDNRGPDLGMHPGDVAHLPAGVSIRLVDSYPVTSAATSRLWRAAPTPAVDDLPGYLATHGRPIAYSYLAGRYPLADYQTVYATNPGSAEMASAGRPFTARLLTRLAAAGVVIAPVVLHAGVSSPEAHEPPLPERFDVPSTTARLVNDTRASGHRVVAVGTTVARALESAATPTGDLHAASGWTHLVLGPDHPARVVTGLVTGLHAPDASHLALLEAVAGSELVDRAYADAVQRRYLWHEFGDSMLFLP
jgi:S-adenosylmethionine:tRNA ribosyltransferase-isomerase